MKKMDVSNDGDFSKAENDDKRVSSFSAKELFNKLLNVDPDVFKHLQKIVNKVKDRSTEGEDVVLEFLKESASVSTNVTNLLMATKTNGEIVAVFDFLEVVFLRICGDLRVYKEWAIAVVKQLLQKEVVHIFNKGLQGNSEIRKISTLRLLTSMVTSGLDAASEIASSISLEFLILQKLLSDSKPNAIEDVRSCTIGFLMSFLMTDNLYLIRYVLFNRAFVKVFNLLPNDKMATVEILLSTLLSRVVNSPNVSKGIKVRLFNCVVLTKVLQLFRWKEKAKNQKSGKGGDDEVSKSVDRTELVRQMAFEFVETLCCSRDPKINILFTTNYDDSVKKCNPEITKLLSGDNLPDDDPFLEKLYVSIFKAAPNLISICLPELRNRFSPTQPPDRFVSAVSYVRKIFAAQDPIEVLESADGEVSAKKIAMIAIDVITTNVLNKNVLTRMLKHKNVSIRHEGVLYVGTVLEKASCLVDENDSRLKSRFDSEDLSDFIKKFKDMLFPMLPPLDLLFECINLSFTTEPKTDVEYSVHIYTIVTAIENFFRVYGSLLKKSIDAVSEDLFQVLSRFKDGDLDTEVLVKILDLVSGAEMGKTILVRTVLGKSVASFVCDVICRSSDSRSAKQLLKTLLLRAGHFDGVPIEVDIWIEQFVEWTSNTEEKRGIFDFFTGIIVHLVRDVDTLMDFQKNCCLKAIGSSTKEEEEFYDKLFDEIQSEKDDVVNELAACPINGLKDLERPLSLMVFSALHLMKTNITTRDDRLVEFLSSVLEEVILLQRDVNVTCYVLKKHKQILSKRLVEYVNSLDTSHSIEEPKKPNTLEWPKVIDRKGITSLLWQSFQNRSPPSNEFQVSDNVWNQLSDEDVTVIVQQVMLYLKLLINRQSSHELVAFFCDFLHKVVNREGISLRTVSIVGNLVLNHPVVRENFLHRNLLLESEENASLEKITELVYRTLKYITDRSPFSHLVDTSVDFLLEKLRQPKKNRDSVSKVVTSLVHILDPFKELLSVEALRRLVDCLCEFTPNEMLNKNHTALSSVGRLLACVLVAVTTSTHSDENQHVLTLKQVAAITTLYKDVSTLVSSDEIEHIEMELFVLGSEILDLLDSSSLYGHVLNSHFFEFCLDSLCDVNRKILDVILWSNTSYVLRLEDWLIKSEELRRDPDKYVKIVATFLRFHGNSSIGTALRSDKTDCILSKIIECYWPLIVGKLLRLEEVEIHESLDATVVTNIINSLLCFKPAILLSEQKMELFRRLEEHVESGFWLSGYSLKDLRNIINSMSKEECAATKRNPFVVYVKICLKNLQILGSTTDVSDSRNFGTTCYVALKLLEQNKNLPGLMKTLKEHKIWKPFLKVALKYSMRSDEDSIVLEMILSLLENLHRNKELKLSRVSKVFKTMYGHENFVTGLQDISYHNLKWKSRLLDLFLFLFKVNPSLCQPDHIPIYLASYEPVLTETNNKIIQLLWRYERSGVSMQRFRPIVWGKTATNVYSVFKEDKPLFRSRLQMEDIVTRLNENTMLKTALNFPLTLMLNDEYGNSVIKFHKNTYDPRFLLPLFGDLLLPTKSQNVSNYRMCTTFVRSNSLSLAFASLGSLDSNMRAAGYFVLNRFYRHLNESRFDDRHLWIYLLDIVRNALTEPCARLSSIMTSFLVKVSYLVQNPNKQVAVPVINFIFKNPILDIHNVPDFYVLFNNSDMNHHIFRTWILTILEEGLRTPLDVQLCESRHVFKVVLGYFDSHLASQSCKIEILRVLKSATKICGIAVQLYGQYGILTFLDTVVRNCGDDKEIIAEVVSILHSFWHGDDAVAGKEQLDFGGRNFTNISSFLLTEFLLLMVSLLDHISSSTSLNTLDMYLTTLSWVISICKEERFSVPQLTRVSMMTLMKIYEKVLSNRRQSHENGTKKQLYLASIERCEEAIFRIVTSWRCCVKPMCNNDLTIVNAQVLTTAVKLLFRIIHPLCLRTRGKLNRVLEWFREQLDDDTSGTETLSLLCSTDCKKDIIVPLLAACEYLLKAMWSKSVALSEESNPVDSLVILARLDLVFVAIGRNLRKIDLEQPAASGDGTFSWEKFCNLLQRPDVCEFIDVIEGNDCPLKSISVVSLALLLCESLIQNNDDSEKFSQLFIQSVTMETNALKNVLAMKENSDRTSEKRKKNQTDKRTPKKMRNSD